MGLDQYLQKEGEDEEVAYWRKNNQLQGWFEENCDQENCVPTLLTIELVEQLLEDIDAGLKKTEGFLYGSDTMDEDETKELKEIFEQVLKDMKENGTQYQYNCWY